jgi:hypothetical protein
VQLTSAGAYVMPDEEEFTVKRNYPREALAKTEISPPHQFANFSHPQHFLPPPHLQQENKSNDYQKTSSPQSALAFPLRSPILFVSLTYSGDGRMKD